MKKLVILSAVLMGTPIMAEPTLSPTNAAVPNPNEMICRSVRDTGSRVARTRVCMTRAQWSQQRREHQFDVENAQTRRSLPSEGN